MHEGHEGSMRAAGDKPCMHALGVSGEVCCPELLCPDREASNPPRASPTIIAAPLPLALDVPVHYKTSHVPHDSNTLTTHVAFRRATQTNGKEGDDENEK